MILLPVTGLTSFRSLRQQGWQISEYDSLTAPLVTTALAGGGTAAGITIAFSLNTRTWKKELLYYDTRNVSHDKGRLWLLNWRFCACVTQKPSLVSGVTFVDYGGF